VGHRGNLRWFATEETGQHYLLRQRHLVIESFQGWCGDNGADERVAASPDVCDVAVAKLAVTKRLADRGHVDPDAPLLDGYVRPDVIKELLLCDRLTWRLGKVDQDVEGPVA
jgi:hypothetical protein